MRMLFRMLWWVAAVAAAPHAPPRFTVDLDAPASTRWQHVAVAMREPALALMASWDAVLPAPIKTLLNYMPESMARRMLPGELYDEVVSFEQALGAPQRDVLLGAILYDLVAGRKKPKQHLFGCTGVVAETAEGVIVHGRNLDFDFVRELEAAVTLVDLVRGNTTVLTATTFAGMPTFDTMLAPGRFSLQQNERDAGTVLGSVARLLTGVPATFATMRRIAETAPDFEAALAALADAELPASSYFVLAGVRPGEGATMAKTGGVRQPARLERLAGSRSHQWYLVQTNYDEPGTDPAWDNRISQVKRHLDARGPAGFSATDMWAVLRATDVRPGEGRPTHNELTVFSQVMQAANASALAVEVWDTPALRDTTAAALVV